MAMQAGMGLSRVVVLIGAGYTGTIFLKNGKLSEILGELQALVKGYEGKGENADGDVSDAIASQVRRLAMEVRQLASARQITVLNGNGGNLSSLIVPAATMGALGYGYMWLKGITFSDLMYVTKKNMSTAVTNLTKHLESVSDALAAAKRHLTQRIENLDGKMDKQVEISKLIKNQVDDVRSDISNIGTDLFALQRMVSGLDGKIMSIEDKQNMTNQGVLYLCNFVDGKNLRTTEIKQLQEQLGSKTRGYLAEPRGSKGLLDIAAFGEINEMGDSPKPPLMRTATTKC